MLFSIIKIVSISLLLHFCKTKGVITVCNDYEIPDYYWRDYIGVIPYDAVPGGMNNLGIPIYIGQASLCCGEILPASIYHGNNSAIISSHSKAHTVHKNIKILCSGNFDTFRWIPTDSDSIQMITNCQSFPGGAYYEHPIYTGRVNINGEVIVGRVMRKPLKENGLFVPDNGHEVNFAKFEVLAFNCDKS